MDRLEKLKILDDLFFNLETHECMVMGFEEDITGEQDRMRSEIEKFGNFDSLRKARDKRQSRRDWLRRARDSQITIENQDGSSWIQNRLEYEIAKGNVSRTDFELMSFHF